jgi:hypothetical protein
MKQPVSTTFYEICKIIIILVRIMMNPRVGLPLAVIESRAWCHTGTGRIMMMMMPTDGPPPPGAY